MPEFDDPTFEPEDSGEEDYNPYQEDQDEVNGGDEFRELYGFTHECHCADDWAEGNVGLVSACYLGMCQEALDGLRDKIKELKASEATNAQLRIQLIEAGLEPDA